MAQFSILTRDQSGLKLEIPVDSSSTTVSFNVYYDVIPTGAFTTKVNPRVIPNQESVVNMPVAITPQTGMIIYRIPFSDVNYGNLDPTQIYFFKYTTVNTAGTESALKTPDPNGFGVITKPASLYDSVTETIMSITVPRPANSYTVISVDLTAGHTNTPYLCVGSKLTILSAPSAFSIRLNNVNYDSIPISTAMAGFSFPDFELTQVFFTNTVATGTALLMVTRRL